MASAPTNSRTAKPISRILPLRLSGSGRIAALLVSVQLDNEIDYLDRRNALIEAVTLQDVNTLARELLARSAHVHHRRGSQVDRQVR